MIVAATARSASPFSSRFARVAAGLTLVAGLFGLSGMALAQSQSTRTLEGDQLVLTHLAQDQAVVRFTAFQDKLTGLGQALSGFCANPTDEGLAAVRSAQAAAHLQWAAVQHLRPGPLLLHLRSDRIAFWPERRNIVARQLGAILKAADPKLFETGALGRQSAAVQGLTALDHLLNSKVGEAALKGADFGGEAGGYRCAYAQAVAANLTGIATELTGEWRIIAEEAAAKRASVLGDTATAAINSLYASSLTAMQVVVDQKFLIPLAASIDEAKPDLAEGLRSGLSSRLIANNLQALRAIWLGEDVGGQSASFASLLPDTDDARKLRADLAQAFAEAEAAVAKLGAPLSELVADPARRPLVEQAFRAIKRVQAIVTQTFPPMIGVTLGFNELDGD